MGDKINQINQINQANQLNQITSAGALKLKHEIGRAHV